MHKVVIIIFLFLASPVLVAQAPSSDNDKNDLVETEQDIKQQQKEFLDTLAELETWVLSDSTLTLADIAINNMDDIVTPFADVFKTLFESVAGNLTSFADINIGVTLELTPENQVMVKAIDPEGRFHVTKLKPNDVITEINGTLVVDQIEEQVDTVLYHLYPYAKVIKGYPPLTLTIDREGDSLDIEISNDDAALQDVDFNVIKFKSMFNVPSLQWARNGPGELYVQYTRPPSVFLLEIEEELGQYFGVEFGVLVLQAPKDHAFVAGDILVEIEDSSIRAIDHVTKALRNSNNEVITTVVKRKGKNVELETERSSVIFRNAEEHMIH